MSRLSVGQFMIKIQQPHVLDYCYDVVSILAF